jgi:hypothetical protein
MGHLSFIAKYLFMCWLLAYLTVNPKSLVVILCVFAFNTEIYEFCRSGMCTHFAWVLQLSRHNFPTQLYLMAFIIRINCAFCEVRTEYLNIMRILFHSTK